MGTTRSRPDQILALHERWWRTIGGLVVVTTIAWGLSAAAVHDRVLLAAATFAELGGLRLWLFNAPTGA